jgi:hypothetical protein
MMKGWGEDGTFGDVRAHEHAARQRHRDQVLNLKTAIAIADGVLALENQPGYQSLRKALDDMLEHRVNSLLTAKTDREAAQLQGACVELRSILSLVRHTKENRDRLAKELEIVENEFRELEKTFKPVPGEPR